MHCGCGLAALGAVLEGALDALTKPVIEVDELISRPVTRLLVAWLPRGCACR
jgi:hypothetical protein